MKSPLIRTFPGRDHLTAALTEELQVLFTREAHRDYAVILSGGNTPLPVYARLAAARTPASPHLHLTLSDERMVPPDDPRCNARSIRPVADALRLSADHFLTVDTNRPIENAAHLFDARLQAWLHQQMIFELAVIGLGPDGHTASLFSMDDIQRGADSLAIPVYRPTPPHRVSMTPSVFEATRRIIILAAGEEKKTMIHQLLADPGSIPCGRAVSGCPHVELWTDQPV